METLDLDQILRDLGGFGYYQIKRFVLITVLIMYTAVPTLGFLFTTIDVKHRCFVDGCDEEGPSSNFHAEWARSAIPFKENEPRKCLRYVNPFPDGNCTGTFFNKTATVRCDRFVYEQDSKLVLANEFSISCEEDKWMLSLVGTINNLGFLLGLPLAGFLSDRYGRLKIITFSVASSVTVGLTKSFTYNFTSYIILEFLETFLGGGTYGAGYILGMELLTSEHRVIGGTILACAFATGQALMGLLAALTYSWRSFLRSLYGPAVIFFAYYWLIDESLRWLIANDYRMEAVRIIKKIAKENKCVEMVLMGFEEVDREKNGKEIEVNFDKNYKMNVTGVINFVNQIENGNALRNKSENGNNFINYNKSDANIINCMNQDEDSNAFHNNSENSNNVTNVTSIISCVNQNEKGNVFPNQIENGNSNSDFNNTNCLNQSENCNDEDGNKLIIHNKFDTSIMDCENQIENCNDEDGNKHIIHNKYDTSIIACENQIENCNDEDGNKLTIHNKYDKSISDCENQIENSNKFESGNSFDNENDTNINNCVNQNGNSNDVFSNEIDNGNNLRNSNKNNTNILLINCVNKNKNDQNLNNNNYSECFVWNYDTNVNGNKSVIGEKNDNNYSLDSNQNVTEDNYLHSDIKANYKNADSDLNGGENNKENASIFLDNNGNIYSNKDRRINKNIMIENTSIDEKLSIYLDENAHREKNPNDEIKIDSFAGVLKSRVLLARLLNCTVVWICCVFVYFGLTMHSVGISGNMYVNYVAVALIEIPAYIASNFSLARMGRKYSVSFSLLLSGVACIGFVFTPEDELTLRLILFLLGKFSATICFNSIYLHTAEMFPTSLRHSVVSLCSGVSRIGSMICPQVLLSARLWKSLPTIIFGAAALSAGLLSLIFPETLHTKLPDTIREAEELSTNKDDLK